ncbi:hypothetical protein PV04_01601 [Phialophora macrospora]|uniref:Protein YTP1-like C-terminal domain-containing protein n=1 Tax=Phialophora macrospora TaxID=1851006 RepID=A0A0D2EGM5_9EURO|nr:hypothetical protein PV04_01601 [Phialophora macrospora]
MEIACSNLAYPARILLLGLHALGTVFGLAYHSRTPDLYHNSSHQSLAWTLSAIAILESILSIMRSFSRSHSIKTRSAASHELRPLVSSSRPFQESEESLGDDQIHATHPTYFPSWRESRINRTNSMSTDSHARCKFALFPSRTETDGRYKRHFSWSKSWSKMISVGRFVSTVAFASRFFVTVVIILAFVSFCTGAVTMAGIFHGDHIFNGLAHFIKGGVFFFFGIINLLRCIGCFSGLGWAWNLKASTGSTPRKWSRSVTMERLECLLIFIYGITNVFLEHLSGWGEAWTAQDLEHVAISLLFIGGGLCGMMVESRASGALSTRKAAEDSLTLSEKQILIPGYSTNPVPAMIIFLLGTILSGHHQDTVESTMMHKWVGNFFTAASISRSLTYLLLYIAPARSRSPSRPPSELVTSFCLMSGGLMLMASNRDTVDAMIENELNAMLVATVTMGITAVLMAWCFAIVAVKEWAQRREGVTRVGKAWSESQSPVA